jgi:hypothetical protein
MALPIASPMKMVNVKLQLLYRFTAKRWYFQLLEALDQNFHHPPQYIGNQAIPQLVKNAKNTIIGFRNLLGKT